MLLLFTLGILCSSFSINKKLHEGLHDQETKGHNSVEIKNSLFKNTKPHRRINSDNICSVTGTGFDASPLELYGCTKSTFTDLTFVDEETDSPIIRLGESNDIQIINCKYLSGKQASQATLVQFINTDNINIQSFTFNFTNLTKLSYI